MRNFQDLVTHARAQSVLATIKREHEGLATVLHVLWVLLEDVRKHGVEPDFKLFATILYYIAAFTQRFHHPKEDDYLFKLLTQPHR